MNKFFSSVLVMLISFLNSYCQNGPDTLTLKGLEFMHSQKYDSALMLFKDMYKAAGYKYYSRALNNIADIELELGNIDAADSLYRMCLKDTSRHSKFEKHFSALALADICINKSRFGEALSFLDESQTYNPGIYCSTGSFTRNFKLKWKYSLCLSEIGKLDSAINCLTPFMFKGPEFSSYEKMFETINKHYYSLLLKKYNSCQLKEMVNEAIENLYYVEALDTTSLFGGNRNSQYDIKCSLQFMGKKVWILKLGYGGPATSGLKNPYTKEYCLTNIKKSPLYKIIMD